ncbi:uncharacterized protein L3040_009550 [Drepanopeziza brunnea f. sp. 'multigermtubi']|uniref:Uncharacterized protein n=1 Tax=Marssonina brunnea f. sp. multigermtubi (strain MB_m1) TaxID=1072389 RepID=K1WFJ5_MARBU|nr:uncharacterized protein MBM_05504 [Drepanopeziza brunnea f. sp. 'multigermtubi' MB_m1]EKD16210.1 hypothetical protein MBM_05504 [Drepanopeziza brunnea f. sp. 'multigermtubi' MB_m1]KAJ5032964.1 hypothetical protein L3040_009550 [Drepanopeziza brunnea f. sp. 'multigermtubi']
MAGFNFDNLRLQTLGGLAAGIGNGYQQEPALTFGLELELDFAISRPRYRRWLATKPAIATPPASPDIEPYNLNALRRRLGQPAYVKPPTKSKSAGGDGEAAGTAEDNNRNNNRQGPPDPSPTFTDSSGLTMSTRDSQVSYSLRGQLLHYFLDFLNHRLPESRQTAPSLLGEVIWGDKPKTASSDSWHLTWDESVVPSRQELAQLLGVTFDEVRGLYRCVGAELVSRVMGFDDERDWFPQLVQLQNDLSWDEPEGGAFFASGEEHTQVHFALCNEDISLELAQTLCVLYGIFESQIEKWLAAANRDSKWCWRMRLGMERLRVQLDDTGTQLVTLPLKRYTHGEFADLIYATRSFEELRTATTGWTAGEKYSPDGQPTDNVLARNWTTVNISMRRENKPTTFEFRHHHGTFDPIVIGWWVKFCGYMVRYAYLVVEVGLKLQDHAQRTMEQEPFLDRLAKENVLDVIGFSEAGKAHFAQQAINNYNAAHNDARTIDEMVVRQRCIRRHRGEQPSIKMDEEIMNEQWFKDIWRDKMTAPFPLQGEVDPVSGMIKSPDNFHAPVVDFTGTFAWLRIGVELGKADIDMQQSQLNNSWLSKANTSEDLQHESYKDETGQVANWIRMMVMCNKNRRDMQ